MRLFSYVVSSDTGFAPNPFWGYCTLANCKPSIRRTAKVGDWIAGISGRSNGNKLIYAMEVTEIISYEAYYNDKRFDNKKPNFSKGVKFKCGDNIYAPLTNGKFKQLQSMHSLDKSTVEDENKKQTDLNGKNILISNNFVYFGKSSEKLPPNLQDLIVTRGHKCKFSEEIINEFVSFISKFGNGIIDCPNKWINSDNSWRS